MRYHLVTLGCQMNKSDSERVRTVLDAAGWQWTEAEEEAHLLGVVACSVRQKAIDKVYTRIGQWNQMKCRRPLITFVSGCMLPADQEKFLTLFDLVFTMNELPQLPDMVRQYGVVMPETGGGGDGDEGGRVKGEGAEPLEGAPVVSRETGATPYRTWRAARHSLALQAVRSAPGRVDAVPRRAIMDALWQVPATHSSSSEAFIPIQNGCDKFCTYCAVPYTRGREVSRRSEEILEEAAGLIARGYRSITLLGQNVNSYGLDRPGQELGFAQLLDRLGDLGDRAEGPLWIYFTSPHPRDMSDEVLDVIASHASLAKQIHLPLQSGDDKVLRRMNRQHSVEEYRRVVESIRRRLPQATLFTDLIVGFSGETEEQFLSTRRAMEEFRFNMAYIAMYSPRPGAASSRWEDDVPPDVKNRRLRELNELLQAQAGELNRALVGRTLPVLVTGPDARAEALTGHTEGRIKTRIHSTDPALIGTVIPVRVTSAAALSVAADVAEAAEIVRA